VSGYFSDFLLVLSVIGAPVILGTLLFYGMTTSERRHRTAEDERLVEKATKEIYAAEERSRRARERAAETSRRPLDVVKRKTGTSG
jgi:Flp pilus assembly protein TadB